MLIYTKGLRKCVGGLAPIARAGDAETSTREVEVDSLALGGVGVREVVDVLEDSGEGVHAIHAPGGCCLVWPACHTR